MKPRPLVLVAGADGYIGRHFIAHVKGAVNLVRGVRFNVPGLVHEIKSAAIHEILEDPVSKEFTSILHVMGRSRIRHVNDLYDDNVAITRRTVDIATRSQAKIVYVSGFGVTDESTSVYYRCKADAERLIMESGLPYVILRCSYVVGRGDDLTGGLRQQALRGRVTIPGDGTYRLQPVYIDDLISVLAAACLRSEVIGTFNVLGDVISIGDFIRNCAECFGLRVPLVPVDLAELLREATFSKKPRFSPSELAIIVADQTGEVTPEIFGTTMRDYPAVLAALRNYG